MITTSRMAKKSECIATLASRTAARRMKPAKKMAITEAMASLMLVEERTSRVVAHRRQQAAALLHRNAIERIDSVAYWNPS